MKRKWLKRTLQVTLSIIVLGVCAEVIFAVVGGTPPYLTTLRNRHITESDLDNVSIGATDPGDGAFTTLSSTGLYTGTAGATVTGGVVNLNVSSNNAVNVGSGTTTAAVTIGGSGTQTISVGNGAGIKTVNIGSATSSSATTFRSGTGGFNLITVDDFQLAGGGIIGDINDLTADVTNLDPWGVTDLDSSSGVMTMALGSPAAGVDAVGLTKTITMSTAGNNATITVTLHSSSDPEVFLFDAADEALGLVWTGTEWTTAWSVGVTLP